MVLGKISGEQCFHKMKCEKLPTGFREMYFAKYFPRTVLLHGLKSFHYKIQRNRKTITEKQKRQEFFPKNSLENQRCGGGCGNFFRWWNKPFLGGAFGSVCALGLEPLGFWSPCGALYLLSFGSFGFSAFTSSCNTHFPFFQMNAS